MVGFYFNMQGENDFKRNKNSYANQVFVFPGPRPLTWSQSWPLICTYRSQPLNCIYRPWRPISIYQPWPPNCICSPWFPICVYGPWSQICVYQSGPQICFYRPWCKILITSLGCEFAYIGLVHPVCISQPWPTI